MPPIRPLIERFWEKVDKNGPIPAHMPHLGRCWVWTRCTNSGGYGQIAEGVPSQKRLGAHCVSYEIHNGPIPPGEGTNGICVCHACDNPLCVNPAHLYLDTNQGNVDDRNEKGRQARGEGLPQSKLTEKQVAEIRRIYVKGSRIHGQRALAKRYGVAQSQIGTIVNGTSW